jgi:hypothetical protein
MLALHVEQTPSAPGISTFEWGPLVVTWCVREEVLVSRNSDFALLHEESDTELTCHDYIDANITAGIESILLNVAVVQVSLVVTASQFSLQTSMQHQLR